MPDDRSIEAAAKRLVSAIDALEAALERREKADRDEAGLTAQVHALGTDRSRLAAELDGQLARSRRLETTNREIAHRLDAAIETIRSVINGRAR
jgi:hypothetical protein